MSLPTLFLPPQACTQVAAELSADKVERSELGPLAKGDLPEALDTAAFALPQGEARISGSVGVALYPQHADGVESLTQCADMAMYQAKSLGRDRAVLAPAGDWVAYTVGTANLKEDRWTSDLWMTSWDGATTLQLTRTADEWGGLTKVVARLGEGGHFDKGRSRVRKLPEYGGEYPVATLATEILTPGPGQIRALVTHAGNPVLSTPNGAALDEALGEGDSVVICHVRTLL